MILSYIFMQNAFAAVILIAIMTSMIGNVIVLKRMSSVGDALSHTGLAGIAIGVFAGVNPVVMAVIVSVAAAVIMEFFRSAFTRYSEISTAVILSAGLGLAAVFSGLARDASGFNSYLFGSALLVTVPEIILLAAMALVVALFSIIFYRQLMYITFDEEGAKLSGIPVNRINVIFSVLTAVVVSVSARTVGALVVSSLIVIPIACAMMVSKSYKKTLVMSIVFAMLFTLLGLTIAFYTGARPGGTIVLFGVAVLLAIIIVKRLIVHD